MPRGSPHSPTFASLHVPNFRLYFAGQSISLVGTWMQSIAQSWLVLQLTGSGTVLGLVVAAQFLPVLLLGPYAGLVTDRSDKRRLLMATQTTLAVLALLLGLLTVSHLVRLWMVVVFAVALGMVNSVDSPTRQTFVPEVVGPEMLRNAVSLNSVMVNAARAVGPAAAGVLIADVGVGVCFLANAASYTAVLLALRAMRVAELAPTPAVQRAPGQLAAGLRYVRGVAGLWAPLVMMALVGTLAYEFQVVLPLLATRGAGVGAGLHGGGARTYGFLTAAMGAGAVAGGLVVAGRGRSGVVPLVVAATGFGVTMGASAVVPTLPAELVALGFVGVASTAFVAIGNTTLQLVSDSRYRGRVMALWSVTFLGSTPIGGPIIGVVAQHAGARVGLGLGAVACLAAAVVGLLALPRVPGHHRVLERPAPRPVPQVGDRT